MAVIIQPCVDDLVSGMPLVQPDTAGSPLEAKPFRDWVEIQGTVTDRHFRRGRI